MKIVIVHEDAQVPVEVYHPQAKISIVLWYTGDHYDWLQLKAGMKMPDVLTGDMAIGAIKDRRGVVEVTLTMTIAVSRA